MWFRTAIFVLVQSMALAAADLRGIVTVERKLTHKHVTSPAGLYQRGLAVPLGTDSDEDPLSFERSHVVVFIENATREPAASNPSVVMEQRDRRFVQDLLVIPAGSAVSFPNSDPIFHNVFSLSKVKSFDLGNYPKGQTRIVLFLSPGIVAVYCHLHPNRAASIVVTPGRWGTKADTAGRYVLKGIPAGIYTVVAWHKFAGTFRRVVRIGPEGDAELDFVLPYVDPPAADHLAH